MQVPDHVRAAADKPLYNHRSQPMDDLLAKLETECRHVFGTGGDVLFLAGSGTGAMESAICNLTSPGEKIMVIVGGTFAGRWVQIAKAYGLTVREVEVDWRRGATVEEVENGLRQWPHAEVVFHTWSESSTGVLNDMGEVGKLIRSHNKLLVADAVSGLAISPLHMDDKNIDAVVVGSQKGLMLPPGLGVVAAGPRAWEKV